MARSPPVAHAGSAGDAARPAGASRVERRLEWPLRCGALEDIARPRAGGDAQTRVLVLGGLSLRWLAGRDGVPPRRYARHGIVTATSDGAGATNTRLDTLLRHLEHSLGVNRVFARLAADARRASYRLVEWRNEAESTRRFMDAGRTHKLAATTTTSDADQAPVLITCPLRTIPWDAASCSTLQVPG